MIFRLPGEILAKSVEHLDSVARKPFNRELNL